MNSLYQILTQQYSNQGIQDLDVFYDSYIFNLKIKDSSSNYNILLIEKVQFDYGDGNISRIKNPLTLNFGDTETDTPYFSNGNSFIKAILNKKTKTVYLIGIRKMQNGNTIPVVYLYDINQHQLQNIFPKSSDIDNFNGFSNFSFKSDNLPICNIIDDKLYVVFQTQDGSYNYVNSLVFRLKSENCELISYEITKYDFSKNIQFTNINEDFLNYKIGNYNGVLKRTNVDAYVIPAVGLLLDDDITELALDSSVTLGVDL